ncbi:MAG: sigma-70 family RNA polymerase sigma factor [Paludibacteraceae bacterium]|nr:sigma-70 family RNA polymerase sigma factor [Paludibacteraceae bacterium]MBQ9101117.1 sigma-70 family RNA polymerase sigma factor [Paludibacteraceae bacterium]MBR6659964.1 sigma-70 family RNA polymerase sigma factor [Paludibacteraceae bacterium]
MEFLKSLTDEELVQLYAEGNNEAFDVLLLRHKKRVYTYIYTTVKDVDIANDLFQETFIKAITTIKRGRYTEKGKFSSWILRISHNLTIDYFRKEKNENTISNEEYGLDLLNNIKLYDTDMQEHSDKEETLTNLVGLIELLPDCQKEVLKMRIFEDISFKDIADKTQVSINTALGRMRYAVMNMKRLAKEHNIYVEF